LLVIVLAFVFLFPSKDYGVNDGGNLVSHRDTRKKLFLNFIAESNAWERKTRATSSSSSPSSSSSSSKAGRGDELKCNDEATPPTSLSSAPLAENKECVQSHAHEELEASERIEDGQEWPHEEHHEKEEEEEEGVYSSFTVGESPLRVKVLLLDTRFHRDSHWLRSLGEVKSLPLSALLAATLRVLTTFLDLGSSRSHDGDMLGEKQWAWLEEELRGSDADFHVVASSVQVFTTNPGERDWVSCTPARKPSFLSCCMNPSIL
jgi:hypothetical protein